MEKADIIINGRAQVVEILKRLPEDHKNKILKSLKGKNSSLAHELTWQTLTFDGLKELKEAQIKLLLDYVSSPVIAIALFDQDVEVQKRFLGNVSRERAREIFQQLKSQTPSLINCKKAQNKITDIATTLIQKKALGLD
jgi:flagellar motor switch protein FliG